MSLTEGRLSPFSVTNELSCQSLWASCPPSQPVSGAELEQPRPVAGNDQFLVCFGTSECAEWCWGCGCGLLGGLFWVPILKLDRASRQPISFMKSEVFLKDFCACAAKEAVVGYLVCWALPCVPRALLRQGTGALLVAQLALGNWAGLCPRLGRYKLLRSCMLQDQNLPPALEAAASSKPAYPLP